MLTRTAIVHRNAQVLVRRLSTLRSTKTKGSRAGSKVFSGIKVNLKNGTVLDIPSSSSNSNILIDDAMDEPPSGAGRVRGRKKGPVGSLRTTQVSDKFTYNSDRFNKECMKLIIPEELEKKSYSLTLDISGIRQETVYPDGTDTTKPANTFPPQLAGELHRILYEPLTLHQLRDPRSGVYLFDPRLEVITPEFLKKKTFPEGSKAQDGDSPVFTTPYKDKALMAVAKENRRKYISSSSSMTSILSQMHFLFSNFRMLNIDETPISQKFPHDNCTFSNGAKFPATVIMRKMNKKCRSIDSDRSFDKEIVLSILGHALEEFLTVPPKEIPAADVKGDDFYHYSKIGKFIVRSQLDAHDPKLPGTGVFDLKTRAVSAIRHDLAYVENNNNSTGYQIDKVHGQYESLEKEFFELTRATLLKYSLQSRIGKMDGIFVAYHNIANMFGFQYLPQDELDFIIHSKHSSKFKDILHFRSKDIIHSVGKTDYIVNHLHQQREVATRVADAEFKASFVLLQNLLGNIEREINKEVKEDDWDKCKIMMQTTTNRVKLSNDEMFEYPILEVIAFPLPLDYKDEYVVSPNTRPEDVEDAVSAYETKIENEATNEKFTKNMVGFQIRLSHTQNSNNPVVQYVKRDHSKKQKTKIEHSSTNILNGKNYYSRYPTFQTPNFFQPDDVDSWRMKTFFTPMKDQFEMSKLYLKYSSTKISALRNQSIVVEDPANMVSQTRKKGDQEKQAKDPENGKLSDLKVTLRAYSLKGSKSTSAKDDTLPKKMWHN